MFKRWHEKYRKSYKTSQLEKDINYNSNQSNNYSKLPYTIKLLKFPKTQKP